MWTLVNPNGLIQFRGLIFSDVLLRFTSVRINAQGTMRLITVEQSCGGPQSQVITKMCAGNPSKHWLLMYPAERWLIARLKDKYLLDGCFWKTSGLHGSLSGIQVLRMWDSRLWCPRRCLDAQWSFGIKSCWKLSWMFRTSWWNRVWSYFWW